MTEDEKLKIQSAVSLATAFHSGQFRTGGDKALPYIVHPMMVMQLVWQWGAGTPVNMAAAVCHDLMEDTTIKYEELESTIGKDAAYIVLELTFPANKYPNKEDRERAKLAYLKDFASPVIRNGLLVAKSVNALVIKLADRVSNTNDFLYDRPHYAETYWDKAASLMEGFKIRQPEISKAFGDATVRRIDATLKRMQSRLNSVLCPM